MKALWTSKDARKATGGETAGKWAAQGVSIDTRTLKEGDLFVALTDKRDGHEFVAEALSKGAAAAMVSRVPEGVTDAAKLLIVDDVLGALGRLAKAARKRSKAKIVAVTGSVGKTSTKEMLRLLLGHQGKVHAAEASFNNHWGVPLTLARMPEDTDFAVVEIGMNAPGEIAPLSRLARPHVAVVTSVAAAHLAAFDDLADIAHEKGSVFRGLRGKGTAILNADLDTTSILVAAAGDRRRLTFGWAEGADARLCRVTPSETTTVVEAELLGEPVLFKLATPGVHFAMNALAALTVVRALGADTAIAAADLARWVPPVGRGGAERLALDPVEDWAAKLIDDAFNSNPASLSAALDVLALTEPRDNMGRVSRGRRIAVLGDMLELGPDGPEMHRALADHPAMAVVDRVDCVGPLMAGLWEALPADKRGARVERAEDLAAEAHRLIDAGDVVLVKGSKASRVSLVVEAFRRLGHGRARARG